MPNAAEYGVAAVIAVVNGFYMWLFHSMLMRVGAALMMVGLVYIVLQLHRRGSAARCLWLPQRRLTSLWGS